MTPAELVASKRVVLLDFDGPICAVFGGLAAERVATELRRRLGLTANHSAVTRDPFDILRYAAAEGEREAAAAERELTRLEIEAVESAVPTPGAENVLHSLDRAGHTIAAVSNNSIAAVSAYLYAHGLEGYVQIVSARDDADPALLKPNPHVLLRAMKQLGAEPDDCVMVGDSVADIEAAHAAGVAVVAYANKPGKREGFERAKPSAIIENLADLCQGDSTP